jgi:serine-type D-Ala-D-Ala carboxypeptidase (penicillin-binding protein 5/6)
MIEHKMHRRNFVVTSGWALGGWLLAPGFSRQIARADELAEKKQPDRIGGPPLVSAKAWAILDGATGKLLWGDHDTDTLAMASTTKILTAWLVLDLMRNHPQILEETLTVSEHAAKTGGSSAKIQTGDQVSVGDLMYGLLLPSGNDAAVALAEHCGERYRQLSDPEAPHDVFVAQMNRQAQSWDLGQTRYVDPHGVGKNQTSAGNLARLAWNAMQSDAFRKLVQTRRYQCEVLDAQGEKRPVTWDNTNRLLEIEGYEGVKTGTTSAAGSCLVASGRRGADHLIVVVLGSTSNDSRYLDSRNLFRWAWRERGHAVD